MLNEYRWWCHRVIDGDFLRSLCWNRHGYFKTAICTGAVKCHILVWCDPRSVVDQTRLPLPMVFLSTETWRIASIFALLFACDASIHVLAFATMSSNGGEFLSDADWWRARGPQILDGRQSRGPQTFNGRQSRGSQNLRWQTVEESSNLQWQTVRLNSEKSDSEADEEDTSMKRYAIENGAVPTPNLCIIIVQYYFGNFI